MVGTPVSALPLRALPRRLPRLFAALAACSTLVGSGRDEGVTLPSPQGGDRTAAPGESAAVAGGEVAKVEGAPAASAGGQFTLLAGGDVSYGRGVGRALLNEPGREFFAALKPLLATADLRFANLESQLSDQKGETESPHSQLIFTGPPEGAASLAGAGFDVVSLANNHALDYGKRALLETMGHLDRAGVRYVGAGRARKQAYGPLIVERGGFRLAMVAVTDIWNQDPRAKQPGGDLVARADLDGLPAVVRALKKDRSLDALAVSYHGGREFVDEPLERTRTLLRAAIDAGADVVIGHHPHVTQGVEWRGGKPILYSLGNFLMHMHSNHAWVDMGYLARIRLVRGATPRVEACPFRAEGGVPRPFVGDSQRGAHERAFFDHLEQISRPLGGVAIGAPGDDGCAEIGALEKVPRAAVKSRGR